MPWAGMAFGALMFRQEARMQRNRIGYTLDDCLSVVDAGAGEASTITTFSDFADNKAKF